MGCDIHAIMERRRYPGDPMFADVWVNAGDPDLDREYRLFGVLAGVRSVEMPSLSRDRGLPDDVTDIFESYAESWHLDAHNHGWVTLAEMKAYDPAPYPYPEQWDDLIAKLDSLPGGEDDKRLVFFFDN